MFVNRQNTQINCMSFSFHVYFIFSMTMQDSWAMYFYDSEYR